MADPITLTPIVPLDRQYPHVDTITEWDVQQTIRLLWDRVFSLQEQLTAANASLQQIAGVVNAQNGELESVNQTAQQAYALAQNPSQSTFPPGTEPPDLNCPDDGQAKQGVNDAPGNGDVGVVPQTRYEAGRIIGGTANEYPLLLAPTPDLPTREANIEELLLRMIWHLQQAGFTAGRQRNPSSAISKDKLTVQADGELWAYDVFVGVDPAEAVPVTANRVCPADYVADAGIPD